MGRVVTALVIGSLLLTGCGDSSPSASHPASSLTRVTIAMGYIANVQFAPFYVAQARGFYRRAGLDVHLQYGIEPNLLRLASTGRVDFVDSGGDEVLAAASQGLHVRYVLTQYSRFPTAIFSLAQTGIRRPADLRGHSIGIPGPYGASYVGLLALLRHYHIPTSGVSIKSINFTQAQSVSHHRVDAAVGYAMNEPVQLRQQGHKVNEIDVYHVANIAGAGIATSTDEIAHHPGTVRAFVAATIAGMKETLQHPDQAFRIAESAVPEIKAQPKIQRAVLFRALDFWRAEKGHSLGWSNRNVWDTTARLLLLFKQIPHSVHAERFFTNQFLPSG